MCNQGPINLPGRQERISRIYVIVGFSLPWFSPLTRPQEVFQRRPAHSSPLDCFKIKSTIQRFRAGLRLISIRRQRKSVKKSPLWPASAVSCSPQLDQCFTPTWKILVFFTHNVNLQVNTVTLCARSVQTAGIPPTALWTPTQTERSSLRGTRSLTKHKINTLGKEKKTLKTQNSGWNNSVQEDIFTV